MTENSILCRFIRDNADWEDKLAKPPYCIKLKKDKDLCLFKYDAYASDFHSPEVQEARGIIINMKTCDVVCWPFRKFANYTEDYADTIDWQSARVTEKIDGSIMKLWFDHRTGKWQISTDNVIDASKALLRNYHNGSGAMISFKTLFDTASQGKLDYDRLDPNKTYIFELVSPINTVVIQYKNHDIWHIGTRNNKTGQESIEDIGIKQPRTYALSDLKNCIDLIKSIQTSKDMPDRTDFEGLVVNDKNFNRIKIKNRDYILLHAHATGSLNKKDIMCGLLNGDAEELISLYPSSRHKIDTLLAQLNNFRNELQQIYDIAVACYESTGRDRKKFAENGRVNLRMDFRLLTV